MSAFTPSYIYTTLVHSMIQSGSELESPVFWYVMPYSLAEHCWRFGFCPRWLATLSSSSRAELTGFQLPTSNFRCQFSTGSLKYTINVRVTLRLAVYCQLFRLGVKPLETHEQICFIRLNPCCHSLYVTSPLTRVWVCLLWICWTFCEVCVSHI
jgi:hypothetical protein